MRCKNLVLTFVVSSVLLVLSVAEARPPQKSSEPYWIPQGRDRTVGFDGYPVPSECQYYRLWDRNNKDVREKFGRAKGWPIEYFPYILDDKKRKKRNDEARDRIKKQQKQWVEFRRKEWKEELEAFLDRRNTLKTKYISKWFDSEKQLIDQRLKKEFPEVKVPKSVYESLLSELENEKRQREKILTKIEQLESKQTDVVETFIKDFDAIFVQHLKLVSALSARETNFNTNELGIATLHVKAAKHAEALQFKKFFPKIKPFQKETNTFIEAQVARWEKYTSLSESIPKRVVQYRMEKVRLEAFAKGEASHRTAVLERQKRFEEAFPWLQMENGLHENWHKKQQNKREALVGKQFGPKEARAHISNPIQTALDAELASRLKFLSTKQKEFQREQTRRQNYAMADLSQFKNDKENTSGQVSYTQKQVAKRWKVERERREKWEAQFGLAYSEWKQVWIKKWGGLSEDWVSPTYEKMVGAYPKRKVHKKHGAFAIRTDLKLAKYLEFGEAEKAKRKTLFQFVESHQAKDDVASEGRLRAFRVSGDLAIFIVDWFRLSEGVRMHKQVSKTWLNEASGIVKKGAPSPGWALVFKGTQLVDLLKPEEGLQFAQVSLRKGQFFVHVKEAGGGVIEEFAYHFTSDYSFEIDYGGALSKEKDEFDGTD